MKIPPRMFRAAWPVFFLPVLFLFLLHVPPGPFWGEGPLLALCGFTLGISHPPGYPLYCIFVRLISFLPLGSIVFRAGVLSSMFGFLSLLALYKILRLKASAAPALAAVCAVGFSSTFWRSSSMSEVYSLNVLFVYLLLYLAILFHQNHSVKLFYLICLLLGLSSGNHLTLVLFCPALGILLLAGLRRARPLSGRFFCMALIALLLGGSVLLYDPLRAASASPVRWGLPDSLPRFVTLVTAAEEAGPSLKSGPASLQEWFNSAAKANSLILQEIGLFPAFLALCLSVFAFLHSPLIAFVMAAAFISYLAPVIAYNTNESDFFLLPIYGFAWMIIFLGARKVRLVIPASLQKPLASAAIALLALNAGLSLHAHYDSVAARSQMIPYTYAKALLEESSPSGILITQRSDVAFLLWYMQGIGRYGKENAILFKHLFSFSWAHAWRGERYPWLKLPQVKAELFEDSLPFNAAYANALVLRNFPQYPVYFSEPSLWNEIAAGKNTARTLCPQGWLCRTGAPPCTSERLPNMKQIFSASRVDQLSKNAISLHLWGLSQSAYAQSHPGYAMALDEDIKKLHSQ